MGVVQIRKIGQFLMIDPNQMSQHLRIEIRGLINFKQIGKENKIRKQLQRARRRLKQKRPQVEVKESLAEVIHEPRKEEINRVILKYLKFVTSNDAIILLTLASIAGKSLKNNIHSVYLSAASSFFFCPNAQHTYYLIKL